MPDKPSIARRTFLHRVGRLGVAGVAAPWAVNLALMGEAAAFNAGSGYKALVCIFLYGGNDNGNTLIPYDSTGYAGYQAQRGSLALGRDTLTATALAPQLPGGRQFALAPSLAPLKTLFDNQRLAIQLNVGPLIRPTTLSDYNARAVPLPPRLFSHNDQQSVWQSSAAEGSVRGWGGAMGDLALAGNGGSLFTCVSVTGNAVFLAGSSALAYGVGTGGPVKIKGITDGQLYSSAACSRALNGFITQARSQMLEAELNAVTARSIDAQQKLSGALAGATDFSTYLPSDIGGLAAQLKMVAQMIQAGPALGLKRQVFMVSQGGYDTHDNLLVRHPKLLTELGRSMAGFQAALDSIGVAPQVTTFTASDFGRTLTPNSDGSDHGWGSVHFVMGGAVKGGAYFGQVPVLDGSAASVDVGRGRLLPTTSVDQFAATLAGWFGVSDQEMASVAPNIANFGTRNLGFV